MKEKEHQSIEWKESWQDEYLKWICGYANAYGGTIYIGTDDNGNVVGIHNAKDLLEQIPNKITDTMGIIADVNLLYKGELEYLQIIVDKYPSLISFRGKYYYRSGSTMREITGKELEKALLKAQGRTWDGMPLPKLSVADLKQDAIQLFKDKALKRGRLGAEEVNVEDSIILMDNLHLIDEDGYLIRAAMLAFYKDPEKWVTGSYIKIGYFGKSDSDLVYQDEVHGPLIEQVDKAVDLVYTKYMKALIDYEGVQRVEQFMFHKDAFREILLNAIVHKDYSSCNPIQISVYEDKIYIWNDGEMPPNLDSTDKLFMKHSSKPYNPKLANVFFKSGMIEAWGRGFEKIKEACRVYDGPLPEYEINGSGIMVLCRACDRYLRLLRADGKNHGRCDQEGVHDNERDIMKQMIEFCRVPKSASEIMQNFNLERSYFRRHYLDKMLETGELQRTEPDKPKSRNQKYYS
jgi:ATP-dependent DNA helicase RecG